MSPYTVVSVGKKIAVPSAGNKKSTKKSEKHLYIKEKKWYDKTI